MEQMKSIKKHRKLKYPCVYRHFKGEFYATMGVSKACNIDELDFTKFQNYIKAHHTEQKNIVIVYVNNNGDMFHSQDVEAEELVLYKSLYDDSGVYGRPMKMFLSEIDKDKYPNYIGKYRFEEYRKEVNRYE